MAARSPEERADAFVAALADGPQFGGLADLYPYETEIEAEIEIVETESEPAADSFQAPEEQTAIMPGAKLVERCQMSASDPPPLPPAEKLKAFRLGVIRGLRAADLDALIPFVLAHGDAYPASAPRQKP